MHQGMVSEEQFFLLSRESALAALSIGQGLTLIRKNDFVKHGYGTQSFFMLSIGIERLLKLIIIYHYRKTNNNLFPDNGILKKAGHNIKALYTLAMQIADEIGEKDLYIKLQQDSIYQHIIDFLTDFANSSRYYNLDILTNRPNKTEEPNREWNNIINKLIVERHYKPNPKKAAALTEMAEKIHSNILVSFDNENGEKIDNLKQFYLEGMTVDVKQKYSMFYIFCIIRFLSELLHSLDTELSPFISEYFVLFRNPDDNYVKNHKVWNPYKP